MARVSEAQAAARVRAGLHGAGYDERGLAALLGGREPALDAAEQESLWAWRARGDAPLAMLVRLFLLGQPQPAARFGKRMGAIWLSAAERLDLVSKIGTRVHARVELSCHAGLLIASDRVPAADRVARDYVHGPTNATLVLARAALPAQVDRALDLGAGTGLLSLRLGAQARAVTATDVNPRALRLTRVNALLNDLPPPECVLSDRFAGLGRRRFDLVLGNLPFVLAPRRRHSFRDAGMVGDSFLAKVVRATGAHLVEGGVAQYLAQWVHRLGEPEDLHLARMLAGTGLDALIVRLESEPVDVYTARWLAGPERLAPGARARRFADWMSAFSRQRVFAVSTGLFTLRWRAARARHFLVIDEAADGGVTGADLAARLHALDRTARRRPR